MTSSGNLNLALKIRADLGQTYTDMQRLASSISQTGDAASRAAGGYTKAAQGVHSISEQLSKMQSMMSIFAVGGLGIGGIGGLTQLVDEYGQMASRIRMVTADTAEYELVQKRLKDTANQTYRPLAEAQEVYIRTSDALKSLGYNTAQTLDVTDSLSYLFVTNAATGERAASAMTAFSKSLQRGNVNALEWQTLLAAVPNIVNAIAKSTGETTEKIRQMGVDSQITASMLTEGLRLSLTENMEAAAMMPVAIKDAFNNLRNELQIFLGENDKVQGLVKGTASGIQFIADNMDKAAMAANVLALAYGGRLTSAMVAKRLEDVANAKATLDRANSELLLSQR
ncbi:MAG: tape measure protein, partial [Zoogloeaceae bacterium]|nr:tape measure protein [Zoogloeaceae bacterium]